MQPAAPELLPNLVAEAFRVACNCEAGALSQDTSILDLGLSSVDLMAVLASLESATALELSDHELANLFRSETLADVVDCLSEALLRSTRAA